MEQEEPVAKNKTKKTLVFLLKLSISVLAFWYISSKISFEEVKLEIAKAKGLWLLLALLLFHLSKIAAAQRVSAYYKCLNIHLGFWENLKLLYIGMFYNLFLPGSVGGDGYKVYLLKKEFKAPTKKLVSTALLDRLSGLCLLFVFAGFFFYFSTYTKPIPKLIGLAISILALPSYYFIVRIFWKTFLPAFGITSFWSAIVQSGQVLCAMSILKALGGVTYILNYLTLFMMSSVAAAVPISISGIGLRELVFINANKYLSINDTLAVSFTLLFFACIALASLTGLFFSFSSKVFVARQ